MLTWGWGLGWAWRLGPHTEPSRADDTAPSLLGEFLNEQKASPPQIFLHPHPRRPEVAVTRCPWMDVGMGTCGPGTRGATMQPHRRRGLSHLLQHRRTLRTLRSLRSASRWGQGPRESTPGRSQRGQSHGDRVDGGARGRGGVGSEGFEGTEFQCEDTKRPEDGGGDACFVFLTWTPATVKMGNAMLCVILVQFKKKDPNDPHSSWDCLGGNE